MPELDDDGTALSKAINIAESMGDHDNPRPKGQPKAASRPLQHSRDTEGRCRRGVALIAREPDEPQRAIGRREEHGGKRGVMERQPGDHGIRSDGVTEKAMQK